MIAYLEQMWTLLLAGEKHGVLFFAALYSFLLAGWSTIYQLRIRRWPVARGRLRQFGVVKFGATDWVLSEQDYVARALYQYTVNGETFNGQRISPWIMVTSHNFRALLNRRLARLSIGPHGEIDVFFNPAKPCKSFLLKPGLAGVLLTLGLSLAPPLWYAQSYLG